MATGKAVMPDTDLEQVKKLAEHLSPEDRERLFQYLAELPDSTIHQFVPPILPPIAGPDVSESTPDNPVFHRSCTLENGDAVIRLDHKKVFSVTFYPETYVEVFFEKYQSVESFLRLAGDEHRQRIFQRARERLLQEQGINVSEDELISIEPEALRLLSLQLLKSSIEYSASQFSATLPHAAVNVFDKIVQAMAFTGANQLRDVLEKPEEKYNAKVIKDSIFQSEWEQLKPILGITSGGARNVKVADLPEKVRVALGARYEVLRDALRNVKQDAKTFASATDDWLRLVLKKYPVLETHPDLLDQINPYPVPRDADASDKILDPWEIAIEIAARETIPNYQHVSADSLKKAAILPKKDKAPPAIKR